nr:uncharacterized protein LOC126523391 [Dermacentor andersoni]
MNFFHRTKKAMWEKLAHEINQEFRCHMTPLQVENKGKSMERAYKKTKIKNSSSGHSRTACEYEGELSEVLEREHHITPVALLAPGRIVANRNGENILPENGPADEPAEEAPAEEVRAPRRSEVEPRRGRGGGRHMGSSIGSLISVLQEAIAAKQKQHDEKMKLLEHLVSATGVDRLQNLNVAAINASHGVAGAFPAAFCQEGHFAAGHVGSARTAYDFSADHLQKIEHSLHAQHN